MEETRAERDERGGGSGGRLQIVVQPSIQRSDAAVRRRRPLRGRVPRGGHSAAGSGRLQQLGGQSAQPPGGQRQKLPVGAQLGGREHVAAVGYVGPERAHQFARQLLQHAARGRRRGRRGLVDQQRRHDARSGGHGQQPGQYDVTGSRDRGPGLHALRVAAQSVQRLRPCSRAVPSAAARGALALLAALQEQRQQRQQRRQRQGQQQRRVLHRSGDLRPRQSALHARPHRLSVPSRCRSLPAVKPFFFLFFFLQLYFIIIIYCISCPDILIIIFLSFAIRIQCLALS